jgi:hypothetical protein
MSGTNTDRVLKISLTLNEYPILSARIRHLMRKQLFARGVLTREAFDNEARKKAVQSQLREGLRNPYAQEAGEIWEERLRRTREVLTDFYFAYNLPYEDFEAIVRQAVSERGEKPDLIPFNPELAPQDMLFQQGEEIERLPRLKRKKLKPACRRSRWS